MSLLTEIKRPIAQVFRRAEIQRRRVSDGLFDGTWKNITPFVKKWGVLNMAVDDVRINRFQHSGVDMVVTNDTGEFNHQNNRRSLWFGYLTRYRTLVRIQAGYYDTDGTSELPTDPTMGIYILDGEIQIKSGSNDVTLRCSSLKRIFDEVQAQDIAGIYTTLTASEILTVIRDHTDGAGRFVFRQFITSTAWTITTTTSNYLLTTTSIARMTAWDLMEKLAEAEGNVVLVNRTGGVEFRPRTARQGASQFSFAGQGSPRPNIISVDDFKEATDKLYNFFRLKYLDADTSTSYVTAGTATSVDPSNASWVFGSRPYEFENKFALNTAGAQAIVDSLFSVHGSAGSELVAKTVFVPQVEVLDRVDVSFRSYDMANSTLWDQFDWDGADWSAEGENFDMTEEPFFVLGRRLALDDFTMVYRMRKI